MNKAEKIELIRIMVVDDHSLFRRGLTALLAQEEGQEGVQAQTQLCTTYQTNRLRVRMRRLQKGR